MLTIYSKNNCPFCVLAKRYLEEHNVPFQDIDIEQDADARAFIQEQGLRTVPQIFMDGRLFVEGGWTGLSNMSPADIRGEIELRHSLADQSL